MRRTLLLAAGLTAVIALAGCSTTATTLPKTHVTATAALPTPATSSAPTSIAPNPPVVKPVSVTPNATYHTAGALAGAFDAAGGPCPTFGADNTLTKSSGECNAMGPGIAVDPKPKALLDLLVQTAKTVGTAKGNSAYLVGPNWVIFGNKADLPGMKRAQPRLGGTIEVF